MSTKDVIFNPIGRQRSELCSILYSGDRFWPFYNFQFFGGREFSFPWWVCSYLCGPQDKREAAIYRSYFRPDWLPTERAIFESLFWGPILAVLQFPLFWWSRIYFSMVGLWLPLWATGQTGSCHIEERLSRCAAASHPPPRRHRIPATALDQFDCEGDW